MRRSNRSRTLALLAALSVAAAPVVADAATGSLGAPVADGPQLTLGTLWGPDFWQAVRDQGPMAFTAGGDVVLALGSANTSDRTVEELSPQGGVLWSTTRFGYVGQILALDQGREIALVAQPLVGTHWGNAAIYLLDPANGSLTQSAGISGGLVPAGHNVLAMGGWGTGAGFAAAYDLGGHLLSSIELPAGSQVVAAQPAPLLILPTRKGLDVDTVDPVTGAIRPVAAWVRSMPTSVVSAGSGILLTLQQQQLAPSSVLGAWRIAGGRVRRLWTWGGAEAIGNANGDSAPCVTPDGSEFAVSAGSEMLIGDTASGRVVARLSAPGYGLDPVAALSDGFVVREVPQATGDGVPVAARLATFDLAGRAVDTVTLPAGQNPQNEAFTARTIQTGGVDLAVTNAADDLVASAPQGDGAPLPAGWDAAALTLGSPPSVVASIEVEANGEPVDAAHPLVVTSTDAGHPVTLRLVGLNAAGAPTSPSSVVAFDLSDGGQGGSFSPSPSWALEPQIPDAVLSYTNPRPGSYVITASITRQPAATPLFTLPKAVAAGTAFTVTVRPPAGTVKAGGQLTVLPLAHADVASAVAVTATPGPDGTYTATFTAGALTGAAAFEAIAAPRHDLGESSMVNVADIAAPVVSAARSGGGERLTIRPGPTGDRPLGFVVEQAGRPAVLVPYGGLPVSVAIAGSAPVRVAAIDADGAQSAATNVSTAG